MTVRLDSLPDGAEFRWARLRFRREHATSDGMVAVTYLDAGRRSTIKPGDKGLMLRGDEVEPLDDTREGE